jgi:CubicO group peptidase (beta-lactamase class C family)
MQLKTISYILVVFVGLLACQTKEEKPIELPEISNEIFIDLDQKTIDKKSEWLHATFENLHKRHAFSGSVLYAEKGRMIYKEAFGYADIREKEDLTTSSTLQLASVSKMFTSTAILMLYEDSLLALNEDIRTYLPEFPYEGVTARLLMNHRSGLSRYMSLAHEQWKDKNVPLTNKDMLDLFVEHQPTVYFKPNRGFHYCNTNYAILANIVERISNTTFDEFIKQHIFEPLKMDSSFVYQMNGESQVSPYILKGVPGYRYSGWRPIRQRNEYLNGVMGDKGVYTSVEDLFKFDQALYNETLISDSTLQLAFKPGSPNSRKRRDNYGFGWRIRNGRENTVYHYGWWKGFRAFYIRDMEQQKSIIVLSNRAKGPGSSRLWNILDNTNFELGEFSLLP